MRTSEGVKVQVKADIGFLNERPPDKFASKLVYVCVLAETTDGRKIHFARIKWVHPGYQLLIVLTSSVAPASVLARA